MVASIDLRLSSYDFDLPEHLVAQWPLPDRDASRLLVMQRASGELAHAQFTDLVRYLRPGDVLVLNDARVIPARLHGSRRQGGRVEVLLLAAGPMVEPRAKQHAQRWEVMLKPSSRIRIEEPFDLGGRISVFPEARVGEHWVVRLEADEALMEVIDQIGELPLPPYIRREPDQRNAPLDRERYQTVYARDPGAAAAPTAGLHFSERLLEEIAASGVEIHTLTLEVGAGTFRPVRSEDIQSHPMHSERYRIPLEVWAAVERAKTDGRRVVAVGTTSVRALESAALKLAESQDRSALAAALRGETSIFIYPGFRFRVVDAMLTNFHLPRSSLIMLVSAFAGRERTLSAYQAAVAQRYRFFSYGDAMLIV